MKSVVMTIAGIMGGTFTSSAVALAQTKQVWKKGSSTREYDFNTRQ